MRNRFLCKRSVFKNEKKININFNYNVICGGDN